MFNAPDIVLWNKGTHINSSPEEDMAMLAACDHIILSLGTFGWWAAWLGAGARQGTVMYYEDSIVREVWLHEHSATKEEALDSYYPKTWLGYDGVKPI